jgi:hypothetical protein
MVDSEGETGDGCENEPRRPIMNIDRRGLFRAIVGAGATFGLALGGCSASNNDPNDAAAGSGGTNGSGGAGSGGSKGGSGGTSAQDASQDKVVTDTFRGWATGVPCRA